MMIWFIILCLWPADYPSDGGWDDELDDPRDYH